MKKFINDVSMVEDQMIQGMVKAYPGYLRKLDCGNVVVRAQKKEGKVALISGGGSGHEPAHGGFVGKGMLDAAVAGAVFTSPTPDQIFEGIKAIATDAGVLMVVKNYTGDVMNFEMAAEMAEMEGIKVKHVVTNDDVAVKDSLYTVGRRGVAGTVFVHKIAGAKAEAGASLDEVQAVAQKVIDNVRTMGAAITPCTVPAAGTPGFTLGEDEMEVGIGIHGEPGTHREKIRPADEVVDLLLSRILEDIDYTGHEVAVMITGSGATPLMELFIINNHVADVLAEKGIRVYKTFVGEYMTSIEMQGFSISLLRLDDEMTQLLAAPADTPAWRSFVMTDGKKVVEILRAIGEKIEEQTDYLTELDQPIGDSDHGINLARGFEAVKQKAAAMESQDIGGILKTAGMALVSTVGGASGPLYGSAFMKAGMAAAGKTEVNMEDFLKMMDAAVEAVKQRGKAEEGEATMLDAMCPSLRAMQAAYADGKGAAEALKEGVNASWAGAEHTKELIATKGRASYVGERGLGHQDPGATSYSYMLEVIASSVA